VIAHVKQWGNSLAVRIPSALVQQLGLEPNAEIELTVLDGVLYARPVRQSFPNLDELLAQMRPEEPRGEYDWGAPMGREVW
jgi:antitoxin MazE